MQNLGFGLGLFYLLVLWSPQKGCTQGDMFARDTTYSIQSNYLKLRKKQPFITPIAPKMPKKVRADWNVVYKTVPNHALKLDVFYPKKHRRKTYPGVLLIHGGGWSSGSKEHQVKMAQELAAKGYVAVAVEYRLSPEAPYPAGMHDLKEAIRWMRAHAHVYHLDTSKIAALGCSSGAQMASLLGTTNGLKKFETETAYEHFSSAIQAVVNIDGIVSFVHPEADAEGAAAGRWLGGSKTAAANNWKAASPLEYVDKNCPPFLFVNSTMPRFHAGRDDMVQLLSGFGIYSEVHTIPETPHSFWLVHPWFEPTFEYTWHFLDKVFKY